MLELVLGDAEDEDWVGEGIVKFGGWFGVEGRGGWG